MLHRFLCRFPAGVRSRASSAPRMESSVLDLAYLLGVLALFSLIALAAKGSSGWADRPLGDPRDPREGGGPVIVFDALAAVLALAAVVYLVAALIRPERF